MKELNYSEKLLVKEVVDVAKEIKRVSKGLSIGSLIKMVRSQLGMTQIILARRAGVPQSTISRVEKGEKRVNLSTLKKILDVLSCEYIIVPLLRESIDVIRRRQARMKAEKNIRYLKGTMGLEMQQPDTSFFEELVRQEEDRLLSSTGSELWEE